MDRERTDGLDVLLLSRWGSAVALAASVAFELSGCVLADEVDTELVAVCTEALPVAFEEHPPGLYLTSFPIDGTGLQLGGTYAALATAELEILGGVENVSFARSVAIDLRDLEQPAADVRLAEIIEPGRDNPLTATGNGDTNLVEYFAGGRRAELRIEILGDAPVPEFAGTFQACLDVDGWSETVR